jgi:hypothetical protein
VYQTHETVGNANSEITHGGSDRDFSRPGNDYASRWRLTDKTITQYEVAVGASFQPDLKTFLRCMNGTDIPAIDVRGSSAEPPRFAPGFYSYPGDLELIKERIESASTDKVQLAATLEESGFHLPDDAKLIPICGHRYLVCCPILDSSPVLSVWDASDAIVDGRFLLKYFEREVLSERSML